MKITTKNIWGYTIGLGIFLFIIVAILWEVKLPYDGIYKHSNEMYFGSIHILLNLLFIIGGVISFGIGMGYIINYDELRYQILYEINFKKINMKVNKKIKIIVILIAIFISLYFMIKPHVSGAINLYNETTNLSVEFNNKMYERELYFDKMWKVYLEKNNICQLNKDAFIDVTTLIMNGRKDGSNVAWKWLQENQPIPYNEFTIFYADLSRFIHSQREGYFALEKECIAIVNKHNILIKMFPNIMYNKLLNIDEIKYEVGFISDKTETVFDNKKENL